MASSERICVRLGDLRAQLEREAKKRRVTVSKAAREILSEYLEVSEPDLKTGNPNFGNVIRVKSKKGS